MGVGELLGACVHECVCVWEECARVRERERERERQRQRQTDRQRERERERESSLLECIQTRTSQSGCVARNETLL